jgi:hypothetical protein
MPISAGAGSSWCSWAAATQYPEPRCKIMTNQDILQPVRPAFAKPELGIYEMSIAVSIPYILTKSAYPGDAPQYARKTLGVLAIRRVPQGSLTPRNPAGNPGVRGLFRGATCPAQHHLVAPPLQRRRRTKVKMSSRGWGNARFVAEVRLSWIPGNGCLWPALLRQQRRSNIVHGDKDVHDTVAQSAMASPLGESRLAKIGPLSALTLWERLSVTVKQLQRLAIGHVLLRGPIRSSGFAVRRDLVVTERAAQQRRGIGEVQRQAELLQTMDRVRMRTSARAELCVGYC